MGIVAILATVILVATIATLIFAFVSYFAARARRRENRTEEENASREILSPRRVYFERYIPPGMREEELPPPIEQESDQWM